MSSIHKELKERVGSMILVVWIVAAIGCFMTARLMWEDLMSTAAWYQTLPLDSVSDNVYMSFIVALMLWAGQLVLGFSYFTDTSKVWARNIASCLMLFDIYTDTVYKAGAEPNLEIWLTSAVVSFVVFAFLSEFLFTYFLTFALETFGPFIKVWGVVWNSVLDAISSWFTGEGGSGDGIPGQFPGKR